MAVRVKNVEPNFVGKPPEKETKPFSPIGMLHRNQVPLRPDLPVRTREGHEAYLTHFDAHTPFGHRAIICLGPSAHKEVHVDAKGFFISAQLCHRWDLFNISPAAWNRKISSVRAYEGTVDHD